MASQYVGLGITVLLHEILLLVPPKGATLKLFFAFLFHNASDFTPRDNFPVFFYCHCFISVRNSNDATRRKLSIESLCVIMSTSPEFYAHERYGVK